MRKPVVIYMISDNGAIKSRDGMLKQFRPRFIATYEAQGYRVCSKEEYDDWRKRLKEESCKAES